MGIKERCKTLPSVGECASSSPGGKHQMEVDQIAHGVHVVPQRQAELVFAVTLPLERNHHLLHRGAPPAHAAEALPQALCHAPQRLLHGRLAL